MFMSLEQKGLEIPKLMAKMPQASEGKRKSIRTKIDSYLIVGATVSPNHRIGGYGLLADAIYYNVTSLAMYCLKHDIDLETAGVFRNGPLITSLQLWYATDYAAQLIDKGVDVTVKDIYGQTTLMLALKKGQIDVAKKLIAKGLSLLDVTDKGYSCLHAAIESGDVETVNFVLAAKPPLDLKYDGVSYLFKAAEKFNLAIFQTLLDKGMKFDVTEKNSSGNTLISYVKDYRYHGEGAKILELVKKLARQAEREAQAAALEAEKIKEKEAQAARIGWRLLTPDTVCHIDEQDVIGYRVTEIFNFRAGLYTRINQNMETNAESSDTLPLTQINQPDFLQTAVTALKDLGGDAQATAVLPRHTIAKPVQVKQS